MKPSRNRILEMKHLPFTSKLYGLILILQMLAIAALVTGNELQRNDLPTLLVRSLKHGSAYADTSQRYEQSAAQGYWLAAVAEVLSSDHPAYTEAVKSDLLEHAWIEIDELVAAQGQVNGGGPAFGIDYAYDAFSDGSENPAFTAYTWNSGMISWGTMRFLHAASEYPDVNQDRFSRALDQAGKWVHYWEPFYSESEEDGERIGYWWYSDREEDAAAVHNTSALIAMAADLWCDIDPENEVARKMKGNAHTYFTLFRNRLRLADNDAYVWNYCDDNYPVEKRHPEDIGHALVDFELAAHLIEIGMLSSAEKPPFEMTLTKNLWRGEGELPAANVAGDGIASRSRARAGFLAFARFAEHSSAPEKLARMAWSLFRSTYLADFEIHPETGVVDSVRCLGLVNLIKNLDGAMGLP